MDSAFNIGKITALKQLKDEINEIRSTMEELAEPILTDWDLLPKLYQVFQELFSQRQITQPIYHRQKFLFVILFLFCPSVFIGERMPMGFRKILATLLGLNAPTTISDNCAGLMVLYNGYIDFRKDTNLFYNNVMSFLENHHQQRGSH